MSTTKFENIDNHERTKRNEHDTKPREKEADAHNWLLLGFINVFFYVSTFDLKKVCSMKEF